MLTSGQRDDFLVYIGTGAAAIVAGCGIGAIVNRERVIAIPSL